MKKVAVIMGSDSDLPKVLPAVDTLKKFDVPFQVRVISAHRTPNTAASFAESLKKEGFAAVICAAGKAAHLAGAFAANTTLPIIGIPISGSTLDGMDALLSTVQMPSGIPVATVAIDGAANAAILAMQIIATSDDDLSAKLNQARENMAEEVEKKDKKIADLVADKYK
jgi:5-(carboxyamino)imidazole ribonucleotide mutase